MKKIILIIVVIIAALASYLLFFYYEINKEIKINYDGETISWDEQKGCNGYSLYVNGLLLDNISDTSYKYHIEEDIRIKVKTSSIISKDIEKTYKYLKQIDNINYIDGTFTWDEINEATSYNIKINEEEFLTKDNEMVYKKTGTFTIKVKGINEFDYFSKYSEEFSFTILPTVTDIKYMDSIISFNTNTLHNNEFSDLKYLINITSKEETLEYLSDTNNFYYDAKNSDFRVKIKTIMDDTYSYFCEEVEYKYIDTITNININENILTWDDLSDLNVNKYLIKINNEIYESNYNQYKLPVNMNLVVTIYPQKNNSFSNWSEEINLYVYSKLNICINPLDTKDSDLLKEVLISWDKIETINKYKVIIRNITNDEVVTIETDKTELVSENLFSEVNEYSLEVIPLLDDKNKYSYLTNIIYIERLEAPKSFTIEKDEINTIKTKISFLDVVNNNGYYIIDSDLQIHNVLDNSFIINKRSNELIYRVYTLGNIEVNNENKYFLSSNEYLEVKATRLKTPTNIKITSGVLSWTNDDIAIAYVVDIDGKIFNQTENKLILEVDSGIHNVTIRSIAPEGLIYSNNNFIISSLYSLKVEFKKLDNIIGSKIENGIIKWEFIVGAIGYRITINDKSIDTIQNNYSIDPLDIGNTKTNIKIKALGDNELILDSDEILVNEVLRLESPTNLILYDEYIMWEVPTNILMDGITRIEYQILINDITIDNYDSNILDIKNYEETFKNAQEYKIKIKALGDNSSMFDSDYSTEYSITKLENIKKINIDYEKNIYYFDKIDFAYGYEYVYNNKSYYLNKDSNMFLPRFDENGEYEIKIRAIGNNNENLMKSDWFVFNQSVKVLLKPNFSYTYYNNIIKFSKSNSNSVCYILNNEEFISVNNVLEVPINNIIKNKQIQIKAYTIGNFFKDSIYYLPSLYTNIIKIDFMEKPVIKTIIEKNKYTFYTTGVCEISLHLYSNDVLILSKEESGKNITITLDDELLKNDNLVIEVVFIQKGNGLNVFDSQPSSIKEIIK